jgi:hypothetical protein
LDFGRVGLGKRVSPKIGRASNVSSVGSRLLTADNDIEAVVWGAMQWNTNGQATPVQISPVLIITPSGG